MRIIGFIIFAIIGLGILFGGGYFIYSSIIKFFSVNRTLYRQIIFWMIIFLSFSLFSSMILAHFYFGWAARIYYYVSVIWLGVALNLLMFFVLARIIGLILSLGNINFSYSLFGWLAIAAAVLFSAYGR